MAYPNPAQTVLTVALPTVGGEQSELRIFNELGMEVLRQQLGQTIVLPEISGMADGAYVLRIITSDGAMHWKKLVVRKGK
ncbi:MAG: T9SS type A sorting domain-containing protein [Flavobacteriales bacterium]|nr:T9SS type A sorting domain-containing protein [Flavobacteriales bacterium]